MPYRNMNPSCWYRGQSEIRCYSSSSCRQKLDDIHPLYTQNMHILSLLGNVTLNLSIDNLWLYVNNIDAELISADQFCAAQSCSHTFKITKNYFLSSTVWLIQTCPKPYLNNISLTFDAHGTLPASLRLMSKCDLLWRKEAVGVNFIKSCLINSLVVCEKAFQNCNLLEIAPLLIEMRVFEFRKLWNILNHGTEEKRSQNSSQNPSRSYSKLLSNHLFPGNNIINFLTMIMAIIIIIIGILKSWKSINTAVTGQVGTGMIRSLTVAELQSEPSECFIK